VPQSLTHIRLTRQQLLQVGHAHQDRLRGATTLDDVTRVILYHIIQDAAKIVLGLGRGDQFGLHEFLILAKLAKLANSFGMFLLYSRSLVCQGVVYAVPCEDSTGVVGASPDGAVDYDELHYMRPTVLMLGEERAGLSAEQRRICRHIVRIPMVAGSDSLNLAVAGSLLLYEVFRTGRRA
jgi:hypothetical protein